MPTLTLSRSLFRVLVAGALALASLVALPAVAQDRPTLFAVNYALSYFAERLGGEEIDVVFPVPEGVDPAFWRPGIADISAMQAADVIFLNGAGYATWITKASLPRSRLVNTSRGFRERYIATETVTHSHGSDGAHSHTATASFTWLDPELATLQAQAIAAALASRGLGDPDDVYARLAELTEDLQALSAAAAALGPQAEGVTLIATHPRYQYLARAAGLDIRALEWEAGTAPDAAQLDALTALQEASGAKVLLWEAAPPQAARDAVAAMGFVDVVFPTLATPPETGDYLATFTAALDDLAAALAAVNGS